MNSVGKFPEFNAIPVGEYIAHRESLIDAYRAVRAHSRALTSPFSEAEHQLQSMPDASPAKWHLAHTTWFWETFILKPYKPDFAWVDEHYCYLFNSYYNAIGSQYPRPKRGLISHPDLAGVWEYRERIDDDLIGLLEECDDAVFEKLAPTLVLGLNHEQQHQELIRTDIKHGLYQSEQWNQQDVSAETQADQLPANAPPGHFYPGPKLPAADVSAETPSDLKPAAEPEWLRFKGGEAEIGYGGDGFCYDNELARHKVLLQPFALSSRLVTAGEWLEFMEDGGYENPLLWLSDGWFWRRDNDVTAPLYWHKHDTQWHRFRFPCRSGFSRDGQSKNGPEGSGLTATSGVSHFYSDPNFATDAWQPVDPTEPVRHISYYEADAFAEWRGARLPREAEWEAFVMASGDAITDHGAAWEWTQSAYSAYPGFKPTPGLAGEYNGKFMVNQMVLRGGSPATSPLHSRPSYRNFFYPGARWQYTGVRLARDL